MMAAKHRGDAELWFAEDVEITSHVISSMKAERTVKEAFMPPKQHSSVNVDTNNNGSYVRCDPSQMKTAPTAGQPGPKKRFTH
jgi:hypothetical protein